MSQKIQKLADESGKEINTSEIWKIFEDNFLIPRKGFSYISHNSSSQDEVHHLELKMIIDEKEVTINGSGNGPIDSFINGLSKELKTVLATPEPLYVTFTYILLISTVFASNFLKAPQPIACSFSVSYTHLTLPTTPYV